LKYFLIAWFCFYSLNVSSQFRTIQGIVLNGNDGVPLSGASVFINNSTKGTLSKTDGKFLLEIHPEISANLIISYAGFSTVTVQINSNDQEKFLTIKLFPRSVLLEGITILKPEKDGWKTWGTFFTEIFIGTSDFAKNCQIKNPAVLRFIHDKNRNKLTAFSSENLIIINRSLGYQVTYQLENFEYDFKEKMVSFSGFTLFTDLKGGNKRKKQWEQNRIEVFRGSIMHFMRAIYADSVPEEGFDVREMIRIGNSDSLFDQIYIPENTPRSIQLNDKVYKVRIPEIPSFKKKPDHLDLIHSEILGMENIVDVDSSKNQKSLYFENRLEVTFRNSIAKMDYVISQGWPKYLKVLQNSTVHLLSDDPVVVEKNGSYFNPENMISSGYWGWFKIAEMLPQDYDPKQ
jgi:hypothetical protein